MPYTLEGLAAAGAAGAATAVSESHTNIYIN